jgi:urease subunit alpha
MEPELAREEYYRRYGPTTGDAIRLADTDLWLRVEADDVSYGDELLFGWGKTVRPRIFQAGRASPSELDMVLIGALVVDPSMGVLKTSIGVKDGRVVALGRAGNPATQDDIALSIGPHTAVLPAPGLIATPGAIDPHIHLLTPRLIPVALAAGITTLITAGWAEPRWRVERTLAAFETLPVNIGLQATVRSEHPGDIEGLLLDLGCPGLKIHEDFGAYPELIDVVLTLCEQHDVQLCLHTDGLHESAELEETIAAASGRTLHAYHVEGAGGGHSPDLLALVREPHIICSSTNPAIPFGPSSAAEHIQMILAVHGLNAAVPADMQAVLERIHPATMAAEGPLHEFGAIQMITSDSQGMGRIGETVRKTWQLAHVMKQWRASEAGSGWPDMPAPRRSSPALELAPAGDDNERVLRYLAKYTIEPAITHGLSDHLGTLRPGRIADIVLWRPSHFGVRPELVIKGGLPAWGPLGAGNATVTLAEPVCYGPDWGGLGAVAASLSALFVNGAADAAGFGAGLGTRRLVLPVRGCRNLNREHMWSNRAAPPIKVDPRDGTVSLGGRILAAEPARSLPLSRRYLLG